METSTSSRKRSWRDSSASSRLLRRRSRSSSSESHTPPLQQNKRRHGHSPSHSSTRSIKVLTEVLSGILSRLPTTSIPTSTFAGDSVPPFNPEDAVLSVETWCSKVDELQRMYGWSERSTIYFALSKLRGLAITWYKCLPTLDHSWTSGRISWCTLFQQKGITANYFKPCQVGRNELKKRL